MECVESIQGSSVNNSAVNVSKVIETFKPNEETREEREEREEVGRFKKVRGRPQLVI